MPSAANALGDSGGTRAAAAAQARPAGNEAQGVGAGSHSAERPADRTDTPLDAVNASLARVVEFARLYVVAQRDLLRTRLLMWLLGMAVAAGAGILAVAASVTAVVFVLQGIARGLTEILGGRQWAGELLTGGAVLLGIASLAWFGFQKLQTHWHQKVLAKYGQPELRQPAARSADSPHSTARRADQPRHD